MNLRLATCAEDVKLWEGSTNSLTAYHQYMPHNGSVNDITWRCDGQCLASCSLKSESVALKSMKDNDLKMIELPVISEQQCLQFSRSTTRYLISGGKKGEISMWDLKTNKRNRVYSGHTDGIMKVRFNWNDSYILSGSCKGDIILHHSQSGQASSPMRAPKVQAIRDLRYSLLQRALFCSASDDGSVTLWDANMKHMKHQFKSSHQAPAMGLAFSPVNKMLMASVGLDKKFVLYDVNSRKILKTFTNEQPLTAIDLHQDGSTVAVGTAKGQLNLYDLRQTQNGPIYNISAHKSAVQCVYFQTERTRNQLINSRGSGRSASTSPKRFLRSSSNTNGLQSGTAAVRAFPLNGTTNIEGTQKFSGTSRSGDRDKTANNITCNSTTSSIDDDVFSPLRDELLEVRKKPIGGSSFEKSPMIPGDRPAATGLADVEPLAIGLMMENVTVRKGIAAPSTKRRSSSSSPRAIRQFHTDHLFGHSSPFASSPLDATETLPPLRSSTLGVAASHSAEITVHSSQSAEKIPKLRTDASSATTPLLLSDRSDNFFPPDVKSVSSVSSSQDVGVENSASHDPVSLSNINEMPNISSSSVASSKTVGCVSEAGAVAANAHNFCEHSLLGEEQIESFRKLIEESLEDVQDNIHQDIFSLQVEMLRRFQIQQAEIEALFQRHSLNEALLEELKQLREENKRLRAKF